MIGSETFPRPPVVAEPEGGGAPRSTGRRAALGLASSIRTAPAARKVLARVAAGASRVPPRGEAVARGARAAPRAAASLPDLGLGAPPARAARREPGRSAPRPRDRVHPRAPSVPGRELLMAGPGAEKAVRVAARAALDKKALALAVLDLRGCRASPTTSSSAAPGRRRRRRRSPTRCAWRCAPRARGPATARAARRRVAAARLRRRGRPRLPGGDARVLRARATVGRRAAPERRRMSRRD